jgi:hypothetical protein
MDKQQRRRWIARTEEARRRNVHPRTLERWEADTSTGFPKSRVIRKRRYYAEDELIAFDLAQGVIAS